MSTSSLPILSILDELELTLQRLQLWQQEPPSQEALASRMPFCLDTLEFHQWLQFVLLVRFRQMIADGVMLPTQIALYPMASEVYKEALLERQSLLEVLAMLDEALTGQPVDRTS